MSLRNVCILTICAAALLLQGCASGGTTYMVPATTIPEPSEENAVVTFLRPSSFAFATTSPPTSRVMGLVFCMVGRGTAVGAAGP